MRSRLSARSRGKSHRLDNVTEDSVEKKLVLKSRRHMEMIGEGLSGGSYRKRLFKIKGFLILDYKFGDRISVQCLLL